MVVQEAFAAVVMNVHQTDIKNTPMPKTWLVVMGTLMMMILVASVMTILAQRNAGRPCPPRTCSICNNGSGVILVV